MVDESADCAMVKVRELFKASGRTLDELGVAMGYEGDVARKSVWQFLNKTADPRLSMLRKFCAAMHISIEDLVTDKKKSRSK